MINMLNQSTGPVRLAKTKAAILASLLLGAMAIPLLTPVQTAHADDDRRGHSESRGHPFSVKVDSINTAHFCGPGILCIDAVGTANVPYLGKSTVVYHGTLDFSMIDPITGCGGNPGTLTITAANGDTLVFALSADHCPWGRFTVTGGTGRFEGATGGGKYMDTQTSTNPDLSGTDTSQFVGVLKFGE
jgi:hypothetical protein